MAPDKSFIHDNFLLETDAAAELYHTYAADLPIFDYHCHLPPAEIASDQRYENMTQLWLAGDHYKWRAMRSNGIDEAYCTGGAPDKEAFMKWAETVPALLRNPLYHWTHIELKRFFGIEDLLLGPDTAEHIWETCNARLQDADFSARGMMQQSNVKLVCTTDDPVDDLQDHRSIAQDDTFDIPVLPAWRPDRALALDTPEVFNDWVDALAASADTDISTLDSFRTAIAKRHDFFHAQGCRLSDHGLETVYATPYTERDIQAAFAKARAGTAVTGEALDQFRSAMLYEFAILDHSKGWVQQFHIGAMRNNSERRFAALGPDTGFDSISDMAYGTALSKFLSRLDQNDQLSPTILYNLNPRDNALMATMLGNFQDGIMPGKIQWGSGWWFMDQKHGMEAQMEALSQMGLISRFVGMVTDSRSFLSYIRHEYFRRVLCNMLGNDVTKGLVPDDKALLGQMIRNIGYNNAANYFDFGVAPLD
ncbi:MAG: glucuronate isomerase [Kiritimatiellae bacterium]|nr:glucuronate isomerase [Kiritimatiellia bacterium]